jgi:ribosomal protein S2
MKIKKIKNYKYNLFKFKLIKSKIYKTNLKTIKLDHSLNIVLEKIELHFKKILQVIYEYHVNNKEILFIGAPISLQKKFSTVLKKTKHSLIPEGIWVNGLISNKTAIFRNLNLKRLKNIKKQKYNVSNINSLLTITKKPDLIIVFNKDLNSNAITEIYKLRIPIISLNNSSCFDLKTTYTVNGNFTSKTHQIQNIFFIAFNSILRQSSFSGVHSK